MNSRLELAGWDEWHELQPAGRNNISPGRQPWVKLEKTTSPFSFRDGTGLRRTLKGTTTLETLLALLLGGLSHSVGVTNCQRRCDTPVADWQRPLPTSAWKTNSLT